MENVALTHFVDNALRANYIMLHDIDYMVDDQQEVLIIDQFTGRTMLIGVAILMVYTKRLKPKKVCRFKMNLKLWLQLRFKTTSVCTKIVRDDWYSENGRRRVP